MKGENMEKSIEELHEEYLKKNPQLRHKFQEERSTRLDPISILWGG